MPSIRTLTVELEVLHKSKSLVFTVWLSGYVFFFQKLYLLFNNLSCFSLHKLHAELTAAAAREKETVSALNDAEEVLTKRRSDIARMRDQVN